MVTRTLISQLPLNAPGLYGQSPTNRDRGARRGDSSHVITAIRYKRRDTAGPTPRGQHSGASVTEQTLQGERFTSTTWFPKTVHCTKEVEEEDEGAGLNNTGEARLQEYTSERR